MFLKLFEKYIDLSLPKYRHIVKALKESKSFEESLEIVSKKIVLTDWIIKNLTADSKDFDKKEAEKVEEAKEKTLEQLEAAEEQARKVAEENEKNGEAARRTGESSMDYQ